MVKIGGLGTLLDEMSVLEKVYATEVQNIGNFTVKSLQISIGLLGLLLGILILILSRAISGMVTEPIMEIRRHLKNMALGALSGDSTYQSKDEVGQLTDSYRQMKSILREQVEQAKSVAKGDFDTALTPRSDKDELTIALNEMTVSLKQAKSKNPDH